MAWRVARSSFSRVSFSLSASVKNSLLLRGPTRRSTSSMSSLGAMRCVRVSACGILCDYCNTLSAHCNMAKVWDKSKEPSLSARLLCLALPATGALLLLLPFSWGQKLRELAGNTFTAAVLTAHGALEDLSYTEARNPPSGVLDHFSRPDVPD